MQILLPETIEQRIIHSVKRAPHNEIGGILMGEHVSPDAFRISELTIQTKGGSAITFIRSLSAIAIPLRRFFRQTRHRYTRFNYLGEWHSHPGLALIPSSRDCDSMWEIVEDARVGANFAILLIVHCVTEVELAGRVMVFLPGRQVFEGELIREHQ